MQKLTPANIETLKQGDALACHECDLLVQIPPLEKVKLLKCPRCKYVLLRFNEHSFYRTFSYAFAAIIFFVIANSYSFISLRTSTGEVTFSIVESAMVLLDLKESAFALIFLLTILIFPMMALILVCYLAWAVSYSQRLPFLITVYKLFYFVKSWAMAEVFIIGSLVSLIKLAGMASVKLDPAFYAYIIFALLLSVAVGTVDKLQLWRSIKGLVYG